MPLQPRLLRTYSRRGRLRLLPLPERWLSPLQDRKAIFGSISADSSAASADSGAVSSAVSSAVSAHSDDPDFLSPGKCSRQPRGKRPARRWRLRTRGGGAAAAEEEEKKENRLGGPPAPARSPSSSPSPSRSPCGAARRRQGPPCGARRPLLCSTPQWPRCRARPRSPSPLGTTPRGGPGLCSPPPWQRPASPESSREEWEQLPAVPSAGGLGRGGEPLPPLGSGEALRVLAQGPCPGPNPPKPAASQPRGAAPGAGGSGPPPCPHLRGVSGEGSPCCHGKNPVRTPLTPVVVLDPQEVLVWLANVKHAGEADAQPACQQPGSPLGCQGVLANKCKSTKAVPGESSSCKRACISGFSTSRWGKLMRPQPKRHKTKRQPPPNYFFRPQMRQKGMKKGALELSADVRDYDCSLLSSSHSWGRVQASLSFHKKKKVTTNESSCYSILCTPPVKSQVSSHQAVLSAGMPQCCTWSSMSLLAPRYSCSVLEPMLTDAEKVFRECHQEGPIAFEECIFLDKMKGCKKIGEGVFGEVFQIDSERGPVALKIIPIEGTGKVNGEAQKSFGEILPEIIISKELSLLSEESANRTVGFISLYSVHCIQGAYPKYLLEAWDKYHQVTGSENDRPDIFGDKQLFMVLEFEFGGSDLENMRNHFSSVASAKSILHQVTASLAVAEQELHFEHRDLHWGNVLVKKTDVKEVTYVLNGTTHTIPTARIHVNIIDYTLSRLEKDGLTVFCDLSTDEALFQGTGDYQFDIYRQMKAENSGCWTDYHPHSNVLWLHYLSVKLLNDMRYKKKESTPAMRKIKQQLVKFHKEVLTFASASEVLQNSSLFQ
ncbi:serine/threonine-protein kinase haspin [Falco cherrug]|uniref:serine/threonine-protein kinase haspin n=1 Tax=Falco cherrug TaxID=345164 RepID=UPI002478AF87|nr:serine/threonine-protein kinase haspin [Falco cherrug]